MRPYLVVCFLVVASCVLARPVPFEHEAEALPLFSRAILSRDGLAQQASPAKRKPFSTGLDQYVGWASEPGDDSPPPNVSARTTFISRDEDRVMKRSLLTMENMERELDVAPPAKRAPFSWTIVNPSGFNNSGIHKRSLVNDRPSDVDGAERRSPFAFKLSSGRWGGHRDVHEAEFASRSPFAWWRNGKWAGRRDTDDASLVSRGPFSVWLGHWGKKTRPNAGGTQSPPPGRRSPFSAWLGLWGGSKRPNIGAEKRTQRLSGRNVAASKREPFFPCWWCTADWNGAGSTRRIRSDAIDIDSREAARPAAPEAALPRREEQDAELA